MYLKALVITAVGVPAMAALMVMFPVVTIDGYLNFALQRLDPYAFAGGTLLAGLVVGISVRAYWRVEIRKEGESEVPWLTRLVPFLIVAGLIGGLWFAHGIHQQRHRYFTQDSRRMCTKVLCPAGEYEIVLDEDCEAEQPRFPECFDVAWACQQQNIDVQFEQREKAELRCLREGLGPLTE